MRISEEYCCKTTPIAHKESVVSGERYRFTILTSRLVRIEYNENGEFEDRATQTVINREFPVPKYTVSDTDGILTITTEHIELTYTKQKFSRNSLKIRYVGEYSGIRSVSSYWYFGENENRNLRGTARTLDEVDGSCELEAGIMSEGFMSVLDDSKSLIICDDGWIETRKGDFVDQYIFCYGDSEKKFDYKACIRDFYKLTGNTPLLPRFALGNWWSRYYPYTQDEYMELMKKFKAEEIPFSVAVIDMDWHNVDIDPKYGTGWTGYTWNKTLFPSHTDLLEFLHKEGLKVTLNLHPQEGVGAHEDAYAEMASAMGVDAAEGRTIPFEIENPKFLENYFKCLHHPLEKDGVDFWWIDWQQGNTTSVPGLDPLWMLNHFHYIDNEKNNNRALIFSRYAGPGSHRYPVGFSGDTIITWESLNFQPYFTATASNIGFGWWSHDIGGHMKGYRDEELSARWYQLGVFSPVNRLHSSNNPFSGKEPWKYNKMSEISMKKFLKLRHELIPYLYTMNYRASVMGEPLVQPMYYNYTDEEAYEFVNEFTFGSEMLVSPITTPHDRETTMGSVKTYLPEGNWYDFFNDLRYTGGRIITAFRDIYGMPVFVKEGGIIPMAKLSHVNDIENPENMKIKVYTGKSNTFELYEDDGETNSYKSGEFAITKMKLDWGENPEFTISKPEGDISVLPVTRSFEIEFIGINECGSITVTEQGNEKEFSQKKNDFSITVTVHNVSGELKISFDSGVKTAQNDISQRLLFIIEHLENVPHNTKDKILKAIETGKTNMEILSGIMQLNLSENVVLSLAELLTA